MSLIKTQAIGVGLRTPVTWNPNELDANVTLISGKLTAESHAAGTRGTAAWLARITGKWYFEIGTGIWGGTDSGIGAVKQGASKSNLGSSGALGLVIFPSGNIWNGTSLGSGGIGNVGSDARLGVALDLNNRLGWFTLNGSTWAFTGNPATATNGQLGGWTIGDNVVPGCVLDGDTLACALRTHKTGFAYTVPTGFLPWEP